MVHCIRINSNPCSCTVIQNPHGDSCRELAATTASVATRLHLAHARSPTEASRLIRFQVGSALAATSAAAAGGTEKSRLDTPGAHPRTEPGAATVVTESRLKTVVQLPRAVVV